MARLTPAKSPIGGLLVLLILITPTHGINGRRMLEKTPPSLPGATKSAAHNVGDDDQVNMVKETRDDIQANRVENDHNNEVHGDRSGLGERKDLLPFPNLPFPPPIPAYLLPPPIPQMPFPAPFQIPSIPGVPALPQFPLPPLQIPPFPFLYAPPT